MACLYSVQSEVWSKIRSICVLQLKIGNICLYTQCCSQIVCLMILQIGWSKKILDKKNNSYILIMYKLHFEPAKCVRL